MSAEPAPITDDSTVRTLLAMSGLSPAEDEVQAMIAGYAQSRQMVAALYAMPGVRYEEPATIFHARP
jgi:hypothetical protein